MTWRNKLGLGMAVFVAIAWLILIIADEEWWQLVAWAIFVPIGATAWFIPERLARRSQSDGDPRA